MSLTEELKKIKFNDEQKILMKNLAEKQKNVLNLMRKEIPELFKGQTWYYFEKALFCNGEKYQSLELSENEIEKLEEKYGKLERIEKW